LDGFARAATAVLVTATTAVLVDWFVDFSSAYIALRGVVTAAWALSMFFAIRNADDGLRTYWWLLLTAVPALWQPLLDGYAMLAWRLGGAAP
jgi:hypothetical protein